MAGSSNSNMTLSQVLGEVSKGERQLTAEVFKPQIQGSTAALVVCNVQPHG
jgi:hypothetical protein